MSLPRFFLQDQILAAEGSAAFPLRLDAGDAKHARALRLAPGEHIAVVDGASDYFECEIVGFGADGMTVRIAGRGGARIALPHVTLVQGIGKGDKFDEVVRHATEVGVNAFIPLMSRRCVVRLDARKAAARTERWRAVAKSAAMQAGRERIPDVAQPASAAEAAHSLAAADAVAVCWEEAEGALSVTDAVAAGLRESGAASPAAARIAIVVGPEGGLEEAEVRAFLEANARARLTTLGPSILRTETAGVVASALALYALGGLGNARAAEGAPA